MIVSIPVIGCPLFYLNLNSHPQSLFFSPKHFLNTFRVNEDETKFCQIGSYVTESIDINSLYLIVGACMLSCFNRVRLLVTLWTVAQQAPLSMGFSRQEYWSGLPHPTPGDLPDLGMESTSLMSHALAGRFFTTSATWESQWGGVREIN